MVDPIPIHEERVPEIRDLETSDLSALTPEDFRHWISNTVVQCMLATEVGPRIDRHKLGDMIERHFERLFDGNQFDFRPVLRALTRIKGVSEAHLYIGVVNLQQRLAGMNIEMVMPDLKIDQWTRAQLLREAHEATERARQERDQVRLRSAVDDLSRAKLGALLVRERLIDEADLDKALALQKQNGGRLGSHLVQLGFISEADLARFLGRQLGLPCVTEIRHITPEARRAIPQEVLLKYRLVPISVDDGEIQVAMVDPTHLVSIDEIAFITARRVRPVVAPELVVDFARARFFGIRTAPRLLVSDIEPEDGPPKWPRSVLDRGPVVLPAPDEEPYDLAEFAHELLIGEVEDDLEAPLWRLWTTRFQVVAHFSVAEGMVRGRRLAGAADLAASFGQAEIPACSHPMLDEVVNQPRPYHGVCGRPTGSQWLSDQLGVAPSAIVWVIPVCNPQHEVAQVLLGHLPWREPPATEWLDAVWTAVQATQTMIRARRVLRRVQTGSRPTLQRVDAPLPASDPGLSGSVP